MLTVSLSKLPSSSIFGVRVVLHDISIYLIDIECEPKTYYEQCLNQHRITSKIDIEWWNRQKSVWFLRYWINFWWNLCKNCSFSQFWGIFGGILGMFALNQLYRKSNLKSRYRIELKKLTSCSTMSEVVYYNSRFR